MTDLTIFVLGSTVAGMVTLAIVVLQWAALTSSDSAHLPESRPTESGHVVDVEISASSGRAAGAR